MVLARTRVEGPLVLELTNISSTSCIEPDILREAQSPLERWSVERYVNDIFLLTSIDFLLHDTINCAFVHRRRILSLQCRAIYIARGIKRTLQGVIFPAEKVVAMVCVTSTVRQVSSRLLL